MTRDELVDSYAEARKAEGIITTRHEPLVKAAEDAVAKSRQMLKDSEENLRRAHHAYHAELLCASTMTGRLERNLELSLPNEAVEALARLDARIEQLRQIRDPDEQTRVRQLLAVRAESADLHLASQAALKVRLDRIRNAINRREEMVPA